MTETMLKSLSAQFGAFATEAARSAGYDIDGQRSGGKKALAETAGMSSASVSRMLAGQTIPDPKFFPGLAAALRIDLGTLLARSGLAPEGFTSAAPGPSVVPVAARALIGTVRRSPNGRSLAVLWPSPPSAARWIVTDQWGSTGYESDARVADWPIVGAVPYSPAAGMALDGTSRPVAPVCDCGAPIPASQRKPYCSDRCRWADDDHGPDAEPTGDDQ